jgi:hypothetical protein
VGDHSTGRCWQGCQQRAYRDVFTASPASGPPRRSAARDEAKPLSQPAKVAQQPFATPPSHPSSGSDFDEIAKAPNSVQRNQNNNPAPIPSHNPRPRVPNRGASSRQRRKYIPVGCHSASCLAGCRKKAPRSGTLTQRKLHSNLSQPLPAPKQRQRFQRNRESAHLRAKTPNHEIKTTTPLYQGTLQDLESRTGVPPCGNAVNTSL